MGVAAASTASIFIRFAQHEAPSLVIAAYRLVLATLLLIPLLFGRYRRELGAMRRGEVLHTFAAGLFLAAHFATWITSLEFTTVASSVVMVQTAPLFVALLSPILLRESLSTRLLVGLALALMGSTIIGLSDACAHDGAFHCPPWSELTRARALRGDALALAGALAATGYIIIGRRVRGRISLIPYITLAYGTAGIVLAALTFVAGHRAVGYRPSTYVWFLLLALLPQLIAHSTYNWALRYLPAALVSLTLLGEPVGSTILAHFLLDETPTVLRVFGALLVLTGILLGSLRRSSAPPSGQSSTLNP